MAIANTVLIHRKSATPGSSPGSLANGELALNFTDGKLYFKNLGGATTYFYANGWGTITANGTSLIPTAPNQTLTITSGNNISITSCTTTQTITFAANLAAANITGTVGISQGGTNSTATPTAGAIAYGTGSAFAWSTAGGSAGNILVSGGTGAPIWAANSITINGQSTTLGGSVLIANTVYANIANTVNVSTATTGTFYPVMVNAVLGTLGANAASALNFNAATGNLTSTAVTATSYYGTYYGSGSGLTGVPISTGISGLGTGIAAALAINTGSAGAPVLFNGALGTPTSGTLTSLSTASFPTLNQSTTGSAGSVTNAVTFNNGGSGAASGTTFNGSSAVTISYNTIGAQVAGTYYSPGGALGTPSSGTLTNCTFPTLNQNTTGTASNITAYTINQNLGTSNSPSFAGLTSSYIQSTGLSTLYGTTSGTSTGALNAIMGTSTSATWLISGTSGGTFRYGLQGLDGGGILRTYVGSNYLSTDGVNITNGSGSTFLTSANYTSYSPSLTGTGASGSWGISVTGSAGSVTTTSSATNANYNLAIVNGTSILYGTATYNPSTGVLTAGTFSGSGASLTSIPNGALTNSSVTVGSTPISLGGTAATVNGLTLGTSCALGTPTSGNLTNCTFPTLNQSTTGSAGSVANAVTFNNSGTGAASGTTFNGSGAVTISYNTIGAQVAGTYYSPGGALGTPSSGTLTNCTFPTLNQSTTGSAGSVANALTVGTGLSLSSGTTYNGSSALTISNSGVTSAVAGTGVSVSGATGAVTINIGQAVATSSSVQFNAIGVGTAAGGTAGTIQATNNITAYFSDKRLKKNIKPIPDALNKVMSISGVTFVTNRTAKKYGYTDQKEQVGVIAQEIEKVLPQVVVPAPFDIDVNGNSKSGENYKTVQYEKLVPLLIEAIKEQQKQIDELKRKVASFPK